MLNKEKQLEETKIKMKKIFSGLDKTIDELIEKIRIWWCYPEFLTRPTVISMYGTTGTGKTELINQLVKALGVEEMYCVYEIGADDSKTAFEQQGKVLQDKLRWSNITQTTQGVLLIDEIQKLGFYGDKSSMVSVNGASKTDMWKLLSTGRLLDLNKNINDLTSEINFLRTCVRNDEERKRRITKNFTLDREDFEEMKYREEESLRTKRFASTTCKQYINHNDIPYIWDLKLVYQGMELYHKDREDLEKYKSSPAMYLSSLISTLNDNIMLNILESKYQEYMMKKDSMSDDDFVFKKLLIIITGNLDNVFLPKIKNKQEWELTCEDIIKHNESITVNEIKVELLKLFRPEQVSRFGNNYIIVPSLSEENYLNLIDRELNKTRIKIKDKYGVDINNHIDSKGMFDKIKQRGFFPSQGARPVLSDIGCILSELLPPILVENEKRKKININNVKEAY